VAQLTVRRVTDQLVRELKVRAAANGRFAAAEHREILRRALLGEAEDFAARAARLRERLVSTVGSTDIIRADRDRDFPG
jgi:plasmid stability protein